MEDMSTLTIDRILKSVKSNCVGCSGQNEGKVAHCDLLTCPLHWLIKYHTEEIVKDQNGKMIDTGEPNTKKGKNK